MEVIQAKLFAFIEVCFIIIFSFPPPAKLGPATVYQPIGFDSFQNYGSDGLTNLGRLKKRLAMDDFADFW